VAFNLEQGHRGAVPSLWEGRQSLLQGLGSYEGEEGSVLGSKRYPSLLGTCETGGSAEGSELARSLL